MTVTIKTALRITLMLLSVGVFAQKFEQPFNPVLNKIKPIEKPYRASRYLNGSWQFAPYYDVTKEDFKKPDVFAWEKVPIKIPSPWNVNSFPHDQRTVAAKATESLQGGDFVTFPSYPESWDTAKIGWMRRTFTLPGSFDGKRSILHFDAVAGKVEVYVNGKRVIENYELFLPFEADITDHLREGENEILVGVAHATLFNEPGDYGRRTYVAGSFWGKRIAGIWQDVYLYAVPEVYISDVFVKPDVEKGVLEVEIEVNNTTASDKVISLSGDILKWINQAGQELVEAPEQKETLGEKVLAFDALNNLEIAAGEKTRRSVVVKVDGDLEFWTPDTPNLYAAILRVKQKGNTLDTKYERFGWRQFTISGTDLLLNGEPIKLKGDSWHFMGIPQMTRRYAWAWYRMIKDVNGNAVRLHAQPFPEFYLDMADEMGICVLDETAIWASDGGPKIDSDAYWKSCEEHVVKLIQRDKNHASVFGWSVCNETMPVAMYVFKAPEELVLKQAREINKWAKIVAETDPTRDWISGDGEHHEILELPTEIGHYGGKEGMKRWSASGKPWGIGEQGMGYYGTPKQVSKVNGDRAFESQEGRTEGLALEAYDLISMQQELNASYSSIFNLAWYALKPLEIGLTDVKRYSIPTDGIFFPEFMEGIPGVQPERLGPYTTTFNPGYDPRLPLYSTWPLFDAVKAAFSGEPYGIEYPVREQQPFERTLREVTFLGDEGGDLYQNLTELGINLNEKPGTKKAELLLIDGGNPPPAKARKVIDKAYKRGSTVFVWGVSEEKLEALNALLPQPLALTSRKSSSYIVKARDPIVETLGHGNFYFSEIQKEYTSDIGLDGALADASDIILEAPDTDWKTWNYRPEYLKTASVHRSELESKESGIVLIRSQQGAGQLYVSALDPFNIKSGESILLPMFYNLGVSIGNTEVKEVNLGEGGLITSALVAGAFDGADLTYAQMNQTDFLGGESTIKPKPGDRTNGKYWIRKAVDSTGIFDFKAMNLPGSTDNTVAYLSFWIYSPRSLINLLAEPDMPALDFLYGSDDGNQVFLNGEELASDPSGHGLTKDEFVLKALPLNKGWNHFLIKVTQGGGDWRFTGRFVSENASFFRELKSAVAY